MSGLDHNSDSPHVSFVIPVFGLEPALESTLNTIRSAMRRSVGFSYEIVIVHTPRREEDSRAMASLCACDADVRVVTEKRRGYGVAYRTGFAAARGNIIVTLDADLTYPTDNLYAMLVSFERSGLDFLNTNRLRNCEPGAFKWSHGFGNRFLSLVMNALFRTGFNDSQSGMWLIRRNALHNVRFDGIHWEFSAEIKIEARIRGLRCAECAIRYQRRRSGVSTNSWREGIKIALFMVAKRFGAGKQIASLLARSLQTVY